MADPFAFFLHFLIFIACCGLWNNHKHVQLEMVQDRRMINVVAILIIDVEIAIIESSMLKIIKWEKNLKEEESN